jgi:hypothetical protein
LTEETSTPAIGISFKQTLDDYRELVFQSHVSADCLPDELNALLDKLSSAADRQKAKTHLPTVKGLLEIKKAALVQETSNLFLAKSERDTQADLWRSQAAASNRREWKPSSSQSQEHARIQARIAQAETNIAVLKKEIGTYELQVSDMLTKVQE